MAAPKSQLRLGLSLARTWYVPCTIIYHVRLVDKPWLKILLTDLLLEKNIIHQLKNMAYKSNEQNEYYSGIAVQLDPSEHLLYVATLDTNLGRAYVHCSSDTHTVACCRTIQEAVVVYSTVAWIQASAVPCISKQVQVWGICAVALYKFIGRSFF